MAVEGFASSNYIFLTWVEIRDTPTEAFGVLESALHEAISAGIISVVVEEFFIVKIALAFRGADSSSTDSAEITYMCT